MAAEAALSRLAARFPECSEQEIASALQTADFHVGRAARGLSRRRSMSTQSPADVSEMSAGGGVCLPPPSPVLAAAAATPSGNRRLATQFSPRSTTAVADPLEVALGQAAAQSVQTGVSTFRDTARGMGATVLPLHTLPNTKASTVLFPESPPTKPRLGPTGELGGALEPSGAGPALFQASAEAGDPDAQFNLGACYADGIGTSPSQQVAVEWWRKAAEQEHAAALHALGQCHRKGTGTPVNVPAADACLQAAAVRGSSAAQCRLGVHLLNQATRAAERKDGEGTSVDAEQGSMQEPRGVAELEADGARWLSLSAQQGEATAQCWLGACCAEGRGVPVDKAMAVQWYEAAAAQGYARAQSNLGACYSEGIGVARDIMQAVKWWEAASAGPQGDPTAQYRLGVLYTTGIEVDASAAAPATKIHVDHDVAFRYFCAAAEQGFVAAHNWLGECYAAGRGCEQSDENAYSCFAAGAVEGDADAQYAVGIRLLTGQGVEVDKQAGAQWLEMAAQAGHARSQARFGWSWVNGEAGAPDIDTAKRWWSLAAAQGESVTLPLASYQVPESPEFEIDIALRHATEAELSSDKPSLWHRHT